MWVNCADIVRLLWKKENAYILTSTQPIFIIFFLEYSMMSVLLSVKNLNAQPVVASIFRTKKGQNYNFLAPFVD
jgi:hypothetical protein